MHFGASSQQDQSRRRKICYQVCGPRSLQSADETDAWIETNFPLRSYGLIVNAYLLCDMVDQMTSMSSTDMLNSMEKRSKLKINTAADTQAIGVFSLRFQGSSMIQKDLNQLLWAPPISRSCQPMIIREKSLGLEV
jgi:hypothetical protein